MAIDRSLAATVCLGLGAGALTFALSPGHWPVPAASGTFPAEALLPGLRATAAAVDAACARGDRAAFATATTASHRDSVQRHLAAVDRQLDAETLRAMAGEPVVDFLVAPPLAGLVFARRTALAARRPRDDGVQLLVFSWDGRRWQLDSSQHHRRVGDEREAMALVRQALQADTEPPRRRQ